MEALLLTCFIEALLFLYFFNKVCGKLDEINMNLTKNDEMYYYFKKFKNCHLHNPMKEDNGYK
jgi:hypothetical protein